uniref:Col_cuticle_N domain-containing protein n=1 Tax=Parastrongyloides trichosuri TaxID=131310 RepID=A0A0N4ZKK8_PARTI
MDYSIKRQLSLATGLSIISFSLLFIGVPMVINDISNFENHVTHSRESYISLSNNMWEELMSQNVIIRKARASAAVKRQAYGPAGVEEVQPKKKENECPAGPPGPKGPPGDKGEDGAPGIDGINGIQHSSGDIASDSGNGYEESVVAQTCVSCPRGPPGLPGYKGKKGPRGQKGDKGAPGAPGRDGEIGDSGPEGEPGLPGNAGETGPIGEPGADAQGYAKGPPGPKGPPGTVGEVGEEGMPGERGDDGATGAAGAPGDAGPPGNPGKDGMPGLRGPVGNNGIDAEYCPCPDRSKGNSKQSVGVESGYSASLPENVAPPASAPYKSH